MEKIKDIVEEIESPVDRLKSLAAGLFYEGIDKSIFIR